MLTVVFPQRFHIFLPRFRFRILDISSCVVTPVDILTDWVNSIVLSESTNEKGEITKLRACLDPRDLNKWVKREQHYSKTIDEVVTQLNDAKFFTLVDAKKGYWHVPLDESSSYLTTFSTPFGRFRFARLPFGLVVSQDIFQKQLDSALEGLTGVNGIADDTFVFGSTEEEHDKNLANLMEREIQTRRNQLLWTHLDPPRCAT